jgi:hypothetical protein
MYITTATIDANDSPRYLFSTVFSRHGKAQHRHYAKEVWVFTQGHFPLLSAGGLYQILAAVEAHDEVVPSVSRSQWHLGSPLRD